MGMLSVCGSAFLRNALGLLFELLFFSEKFSIVVALVVELFQRLEA